MHDLAPAVGEHRPQCVLGEQEGALEVDVELLLECREVKLGHRTPGRVASDQVDERADGWDAGEQVGHASLVKHVHLRELQVGSIAKLGRPGACYRHETCARPKVCPRHHPSPPVPARPSPRRSPPSCPRRRIPYASISSDMPCSARGHWSIYPLPIRIPPQPSHRGSSLSRAFSGVTRERELETAAGRLTPVTAFLYG